jgi:hypothetical protein
LYSVDEDEGTGRFLEVRRIPDTLQHEPEGCAPAAGCTPAAGCAPYAGCAPASGCGSRCGHGGADERVAAAIQVLADCVYLLTARIGPKPQMLLRRAGITALEAPPDLDRAIAQLHRYYLKQRQTARSGSTLGAECPR